jgi:hypothetical protein
MEKYLLTQGKIAELVYTKDFAGKLRVQFHPTHHFTYKHLNKKAQGYTES